MVRTIGSTLIYSIQHSSNKAWLMGNGLAPADGLTSSSKAHSYSEETNQMWHNLIHTIQDSISMYLNKRFHFLWSHCYMCMNMSLGCSCMFHLGHSHGSSQCIHWCLKQETPNTFFNSLKTTLLKIRIYHRVISWVFNLVWLFVFFNSLLITYHQNLILGHFMGN